MKAVSVNPVDVKTRASSDPGGQLKILGYDAAGVVTATGGNATLFSAGDEVLLRRARSPGRAPTRSFTWSMSASWDTSHGL